MEGRSGTACVQAITRAPAWHVRRRRRQAGMQSLVQLLLSGGALERPLTGRSTPQPGPQWLPKQPRALSDGEDARAPSCDECNCDVKAKPSVSCAILMEEVSLHGPRKPVYVLPRPPHAQHCSDKGF